jgi:hypothetical protein
MFIAMILVAVIVPLATTSPSIVSSVELVLGILAIIFCIMMIVLAIRGPSDEFAKSCWNSGASAAFMTIITLVMIAPYLIGFIDGFVEGFNDAHIEASPKGTTERPMASLGWSIEADQSAIVSIAVFFVTFQWRRFRGLV